MKLVDAGEQYIKRTKNDLTQTSDILQWSNCFQGGYSIIDPTD